VGFDGVVNGSKLGSGRTVAVFDVAAGRQSNCRLFQVNGVNLTFSEAGNPYFIGLSPELGGFSEEPKD
jgi:hypothetical protein